jgi:hypothetical protein
VDLVLQGEVEGKVLGTFSVVDLHPGGILIRLEVFDDVREPHRQSIIPAHTRHQRKEILLPVPYWDVTLVINGQEHHGK